MPVEFNDPRAWGYCEICAFQVARSVGGKWLLLVHYTDVFFGNKYECPGSGRKATKQPGPEAERWRVVSLFKTAQHLAARKRRHTAWVKAKTEAMKGMGETCEPDLEE